VSSKTSQHAKPTRPRRRWRGVAIAGAAVVALAAGYATANAATTDDEAGLSTSGVATVVEAANAFLDTLSDDQKTEALLDFSQTNAIAWSGLPCAETCRPGIEFSTLSDEQLAAAEEVLTAAMGTGEGLGFDQASQIRQADDVLAAGGSEQDTGTTTPSANPSGSATAKPSGSASGKPSASGQPSATLDAAGESSTGAANPTGTQPSGTTSARPSTQPSTHSSEHSHSSTQPSTQPSATPTSSTSTDSSYGSGFYYLAFLGTPSETGTWQLHFGGDQLAVNLTYADGAVTSASPYFAGVEPTSFTADDTTYQPLEPMRAAMVALTGSLTTAEADEAQLDDTVDDVLLGPDEDGQFPATKEGIAVSELSTDQQTLVLTAIKQWVSVADDATAEQLLTAYADELDETYLAYSGGTDLDAQGDYVRIDGPGVWIEFLCKTGSVDPEQVIYQSVYRDHDRDYGGAFTF